jgi:hypothetical protein
LTVASSGYVTTPMLTVGGASATSSGGFDLAAQTLGDGEGPGSVGIDQREDELLAAVAGGQIDPPAAGLGEARDASQSGITGLVAVGVVVGLELVAVEEQQADVETDFAGSGA